MVWYFNEVLIHYHGHFEGQEHTWTVDQVAGLRVVARREDGRWYRHLPKNMMKWRWLDDSELEDKLERARSEVLSENP